jgi:hypothetical protein
VSKRWYYYCADCDVQSEDGLNHGEEMLIHFAIAWKLIRSHEPPLSTVSITCDAGYASLDMSIFLEEHAAHDMCLISEYGGYKDIALPDGVMEVVNKWVKELGVPVTWGDGTPLAEILDKHIFPELTLRDDWGRFR